MGDQGYHRKCFLFFKNSSRALSQVTPKEGGAPKIITLATPPHTSKHYTQHIHHMVYMCLGRFTYRIGYLISWNWMKT